MTVRAHSMFTTFDPTSNAVITAATVNIYNPGTVTPISPTIFDKNGNPLSNPLTSDATTGLVDFYLTVAQEVDVVVSKTGFTTRTYSNVPVLDDSSLELTALLTTTGDMVYASSANTPTRLPAGAANYVMNSTGGIPKWTSALQVSDANGTVGIGTSPATSIGLDLTPTTLATSSQFGMALAITSTSAATSSMVGIQTTVQTAAAAYTVANSYGNLTQTPVLGAGSAITNQYGYYAANQGAPGIANAYGVYIAAQSGATNNIAIYAQGDCGFGQGTISNSATSGFIYIPSNSGTPTGVPSQQSNIFAGWAAMRYDSSAHKIWIYDAGWKGVVVS